MIDHEASISVTADTGLNKPKAKRSTHKPFEWLNDLNQPVRGETALWVAVITQAMMDALSRSRSSEAQYHKHEAINWLTGNSRNFITVCHFANLDPDYVRRKAKRALVTPMQWRAEAGKGKRYFERKNFRKRQKAQKAPLSVDSDAGPGIQIVIVGPWG